MTTYQRGETVRSTTNSQGLAEGNLYEVVDLTERRTFLGTYVTYVLRSETGEVLRVGNGHLVLARVSP